ncbi:hypothetical protein NP493_132g01001 [Ridgeia piscesae]|uniref:Uncharacterized protein n=1 Tax=Ridgeia piscesae TaxID=27915 RepID=A0AAD9UGC6_RIDPI|nr:hypothetical protein NP493_132g01001 [Ridgeia piscesae]
MLVIFAGGSTSDRRNWAVKLWTVDTDTDVRQLWGCTLAVHGSRTSLQLVAWMETLVLQELTSPVAAFHTDLVVKRVAVRPFVSISTLTSVCRRSTDTSKVFVAVRTISIP